MDGTTYEQEEFLELVSSMERMTGRSRAEVLKGLGVENTYFDED
jgi:hypothetical protein